MAPAITIQRGRFFFAFGSAGATISAAGAGLAETGATWGGIVMVVPFIGTPADSQACLNASAISVTEA